MSDSNTVIVVEHLKNYLGGFWVHDDLNFSVDRGDIVAIVGGSGSGKTTLVRTILMLQPPVSGHISVFGVDVWHCTEAMKNRVRKRWGVMFQHSALFSSLTVLENVLFPLREFTRLSPGLQREIALLKICLAGLPVGAAYKYPSQLSGGMKKRAAVARAIALDPELLFLDEPASGLDPKSIEALDALILHLRDALGLTVVMITHDLDSLHRLADKVAFLGHGKVLALQSMDDIVKNPEPLIQEFFSGVFYG